MTKPTQAELVQALLKVNPETPRIFFEGLSQETLEAEYREIVADQALESRKLMSVSY